MVKQHDREAHGLDLDTEGPGEYFARLIHQPFPPAKPVVPVPVPDERARRRDARETLSSGESVWVHDDLAQKFGGGNAGIGRPRQSEVKTEAWEWRKRSLPWVRHILRIRHRRGDPPSWRSGFQSWIKMLASGKSAPTTTDQVIRREVFNSIRSSPPNLKTPKEYPLPGADPNRRTDLGWLIDRVIRELRAGGLKAPKGGRTSGLAEQITDRIASELFGTKETPHLKVKGLPPGNRSALRNKLRRSKRGTS